jgi:molybdate transport system substrate-binding protein
MGASKWLLVFTLSHLLLNPSYADEIHVAVASNFTAAIKDLAARFEQQTQHQVTLSFSSSGKIFAQIQHGAPFQLFLSADQTKPKALEKGGWVVPGSRFTYALGSLVLWSAQPDKVVNDSGILHTDDFNKLALANPKLAPYGAAAVQVLEALQLTSATQRKWVMGENIAQTYQFIATGNAELGFVALSQVIATEALAAGSGWRVPTELHQPIRQDAVLLKRAQDHVGARAFWTYLRSEEAQTIIRSYGYFTE